jgi:hypothetical protein
MAQFRQPDFSKGDPNTIGGYAAAHDRPAAFEGSDGFSYSVEILVDDERVGNERWGAYLFFVKWARIGASVPEGHLESDVLARGVSEDGARARIGALPLTDVKRVLDQLIAQTGERGHTRKWWDAMHAEGDSTGDNHS